MSTTISADLILTEEERAQEWAKLWDQLCSFEKIFSQDSDQASLMPPKNFYEAFLRGFFYQVHKGNDRDKPPYLGAIEPGKNEGLFEIRSLVLQSLSVTTPLNFSDENHLQKFKDKYESYKESSCLDALEEIILIFYLMHHNQVQYSCLRELLDISSSLFFANGEFIPSLFFTTPHSSLYFQQSIYELLSNIWEIPPKKFEASEKGEMNPQQLFYSIMSHLLTPFISQHIEKAPPLTDRYHSLKPSKDLSGLFSLSGKNSSLGYLQKGEIKILAMGPQYAPLYSEKEFGVFHLDQSATVSSSSQYEGWTRTTEFQDNNIVLGSDWIRFSIQSEKNFHLSVSCQKQSEKPLFFSFFLLADSLFVDGKGILPNSLEKYEGPAQKILLKKGGETLTFEGTMQKIEVLPLAGGEFFWGATYIVAIELNNNNKKFNSHIF